MLGDLTNPVSRLICQKSGRETGIQNTLKPLQNRDEDTFGASPLLQCTASGKEIIKEQLFLSFVQLVCYHEPMSVLAANRIHWQLNP